MICDFGFLQSVVSNFFVHLKCNPKCSLLHGRNWMIVLTYPSGKTVRFGRGITCMATVLKKMNPALKDDNVPASWKLDALQPAPAATATATATATSAPTATAATPTERVGHKTRVEWQLRQQQKQAQVAQQVQAQAKKAPAYSEGAVKADVRYALSKHMMNGQHVISICGVPVFGFSSESGAAEALVQIRALQKSIKKSKKRKRQTSSDSGKSQ